MIEYMYYFFQEGVINVWLKIGCSNSITNVWIGASSSFNILETL